jgi:hypothetical protein
MTNAEMLTNCKTAMRITTDAFDDEISSYINAAELDLGIAGVVYEAVNDLVQKAIITYVRMSFGNPPNYDRLKAAYDEQKAQLQTATGYTEWGVLK